MSAWLGIRFDYGRVLLDNPGAARELGEILARPSFSSLQRVGVRSRDRDRHAHASSETITKCLLDRSFEAVSLDSGRSGQLIASAQIQSGAYPAGPRNSVLRFYAYVAMPVPTDVEALVTDACDVARALDATAGFIGVEPSYSLAQEVALGGRLPRVREGLSDQRRRERRGRDWKHELIDKQIANVEWGLILGPGHLLHVNVDNLRVGGAFTRVVEVVPQRLAFVQLTADPMDEWILEEKVGSARKALAPILMDVSDVSLA